MLSNPALQNIGLVMWSTTAIIRRINTFRNFGFVFEVNSAILVEAVFKLRSAPPSTSDPCVASATWTDVPAIPTCSVGVIAGEDAEFRIPVGAQPGLIAVGAIPCTPDAFLQFAAVSGDTAKVTIVGVFQGPMGLYTSVADAA
ncbi:MAG TPA: hypothetical protein VIT23_12770 [Terrimicrobiaceae bacterium]